MSERARAIELVSERATEWASVAEVAYKKATSARSPPRQSSVWLVSAQGEMGRHGAAEERSAGKSGPTDD